MKSIFANSENIRIMKEYKFKYKLAIIVINEVKGSSHFLFTDNFLKNWTASSLNFKA